MEVIDTETGRLLLRQRYRRPFGSFVASGLIARSRLDSFGVPRVELIPVDLGEGTDREE